MVLMRYLYNYFIKKSAVSSLAPEWAELNSHKWPLSLWKEILMTSRISHGQFGIFLRFQPGGAQTLWNVFFFSHPSPDLWHLSPEQDRKNIEGETVKECLGYIIFHPPPHLYSCFCIFTLFSWQFFLNNSSSYFLSNCLVVSVPL